MFAWANSQLERLSETLAPPSNDPGHRFAKAVRDGDEGEAMRILTSELDPNEKLNQVKGSLAVHIAAQYGAQQVLRQLLCPQYAQAFDMQGNTPLHYASLGGHRSTCQMLIDEFQVSVTVKNAHGSTPYDLATLDSVRQYLLPLQLQRETQDCLDNGGIGLVPGVDLGTNRISNLPPPPLHANANANANPAPTHNYAPPVSYDTHTAPPSQPPTIAPTAPVHTASSAPSSSSYARSGFSSAVVSNSKYRPDGFHSSSSDKNLQLKYGHDQTVTGPPSGNISSNPVLPPPRTAPAATRAAFFGAKSRYPTYDAHSNTTSTFTAPVSASVSSSVSSNTHATPAPQFQIFSPQPDAHHQPPPQQPQYTHYQSHQHNDNNQYQHHHTNDFTYTTQYEDRQSQTYSSYQNHSPAPTYQTVPTQQLTTVTDSHAGPTDVPAAHTLQTKSPSSSKLIHTNTVVSPPKPTSQPNEDAGAFFAASSPKKSESTPPPTINSIPKQYSTTNANFQTSQPPLLSEKSNVNALDFFATPNSTDSRINNDFKSSSHMHNSALSPTVTSHDNPGPNAESTAHKTIHDNSSSTMFLASGPQTSGTEAKDFFVATSSSSHGRTEPVSTTQSATSFFASNDNVTANGSTMTQQISSKAEKICNNESAKFVNNHEKTATIAKHDDLPSQQTKIGGLNQPASLQHSTASSNDTFGLPPPPSFSNVSDDSTEYSDIDLNMAPLPPPPMMDVPLTQ